MRYVSTAELDHLYLALTDANSRAANINRMLRDCTYRAQYEAYSTPGTPLHSLQQCAFEAHLSAGDHAHRALLAYAHCAVRGEL